jgi:1-acyl-sn-glycerol-3-phosphate acyltransferase
VDSERLHKGPGAGRILTTVWFWVVFAVTCPVCLLLGTLLWWVCRPFDRDGRVLHAFICLWAFQYLRVSPLWRARVLGRERLPKGPCVLVANHQSMADVIAAMGLFHPFKFVSKASLFTLPAVGWLMRLAQYVAVERGRPSSMRDMMQSSRRWLRRGMPVLIFPEGTYAAQGPLLPFRRGAFVLAIEERVPLVPLAIRGTSELIEGDGPWLNVRANVELEVLEPLSVDALGDDARVLAEQVRQQLSEAVGRQPSGA